MDYIFEKEWKDTVDQISLNFGEKLDYAAILVLIGFQELGLDYRPFKKDEKLSLMHIAICALLEPYGFYEFKGRDPDGWPHFDRCQEIPLLEAPEQELLIKKAIIRYFQQDTVPPVS